MACILKCQDPNSIESGSLSGQFFETFIINEFIKYRNNRQANFEMYFYRDSNNNELDLVLEFSGKFLIFEIKASQTVQYDHVRKMKKILPDFMNAKAYLTGFYQDERQIDENIAVLHWRSIFSVVDESFKPK